MSFVRRLILLIPLFMATSLSSVYAADSGVTFDKSALVTRFAKMGMQVEDVVPSDINGLLEIHTQRGVLFSSVDGKFFIAGTLYSLDNNGKYQDVLAERKAPQIAAKIAELSSSAIVYKAPQEKYVVTVFTDITCGYCVKLHSHIKEYNDLGITVRYMAFPREGLNGQVAEGMARIWCAADPAKALSDAKVKRELPETVSGDMQQCRKTITSQYDLGRELGISGTPAVFSADGQLLGGYLTPQQLLQKLQNI